MSPKLLDTPSRRGLISKGRFEPTEPLHMTTRHAARNVQTNGTPSINGSVDDNESRRGSFEGTRPTTSQSLGSQTSDARRRISGGSNDSDQTRSLDTPMSTETAGPRGTRKPPSPPHDQVIMQSPTRNLKRKRVTLTPSPTGAQIDFDASFGASTQATEADLDADKDVVIPVPDDYLSDRESGRSSADEQDMGDYPMAMHSTEVTPAATPARSVPVSPVSDETDPTRTSKKADVIMVDINQSVEADDPANEDATALADLEEADDVADVDDEEEHVSSGKPKRMAGRRRAEHPSTDVEAIHRRQLQLKAAYRAISRALKPVLAEIASKTVESLEANPVLHEQVVEYHGTEEYEGVQDYLDQEFAKRKAQLDQQLKYTTRLLQDTFEGEQALLVSRARGKVEDTRQVQIDRLQHKLLSMARQVRTSVDDQDVETEDEDDVIPVPKGMDYRFRRQDALDAKYHSRSRLALESEREVESLHRRIEMRAMLRDFGELDMAEESDPFTVIDFTARDAAIARKSSVMSTNVLADAAVEAERRAAIPVIANKDAYGLQLLGELAQRPSIRATVPLPPPTAPRRLEEPFMPALQSAQRPPPPSSTRTQLDHEQHTQPLMQTSPGTEQFVERSLPFSPHRQKQTGTSEASRLDSSLRSPPSNRGGATLPPIQAQYPQLEEAPKRPRSISITPQHSRNVSRESMDRAFGISDRSEYSILGARVSNDATWDKFHNSTPRTPDARSLQSPRRMIHEFSRSGPLSKRLAPREEDWTRSTARSDARAIEVYDATSPARDASPARMLRPQEKSLPVEASTLPVEDAPSQDISDEAMTGTEEGRPTAILPVVPESTGKANDQVELPNEVGAADVSDKDEAAANEGLTQEPIPEVSAKRPRSRGSSLGQSTATDDVGSQDGDSVHRRRAHGGSQDFKKTNKAQRHGMSRKAHRESRSFNKRSGPVPYGSEGGSQMFRFRLNTTSAAEPPKAMQMWPPAMGGMPGGYPPFPPLPAYSQPPPHFGPPPGPYLYQYDPHYYPPSHRNSIGAGPPPGQYWPPSPYHPNYGLPQGPPMGPPPPEGRLGFPPDGPPPLAQQHSQPSPGAFSTKYGGPAIAPATADARYPYGSGTPGATHGPAFAQQQRNSEHGGRRRTHSDQPKGTKFHHYAPKDKDKDREK